MQEQIDSGELSLDKDDNQYISSLYIDGQNVKIELNNGNIVEGPLNSLDIRHLTLDKLSIYDSDYVPGTNSSDISKRIDIYFDDVKVLNEFKYRRTPPGSSIVNMKRIAYNGIDYSSCKKVWLSNQKVYQSLFDTCLSNPRLETLIIDDCEYVNDTEDMKLTVKAPNLRDFYFSIGFVEYIDNIRYIDLSGSPKIENLSLGCGTTVESLDYVKPLKSLKVFSLGTHSYDNAFDLDKSFEEKIESIKDTYDISNRDYVSKTPTCYIFDYSALYGKEELEFINICFFYNIKGSDFLNLVKSLPNLNTISGLEVNNANLATPELIEYCKENGIIHPFTERSLSIRFKIDEILAETITPEMTDKEKVRAISKYIVEHYKYYNTEDNPNNLNYTQSTIIAWGENKYYALMDGDANCSGYTASGQALLNEVDVHACSTRMHSHIFLLVEDKGQWYVLDITTLDTHINEYYDGNTELFDWIGNEGYYLVPIAEDDWHEAYAYPLDAAKQKNLYQLYTPMENYSEPLYTATKNKSPMDANTESKLLLLFYLGYAVPTMVTMVNILRKEEDIEFVDSLMNVKILKDHPPEPFPMWSKDSYYDLIAQIENERKVKDSNLTKDDNALCIDI